MSPWKYVDSENDELFKEALIEKLGVIGHNLHALAELRVLDLDIALKMTSVTEQREDLNHISARLEDW